MAKYNHNKPGIVKPFDQRGAVDLEAYARNKREDVKKDVAQGSISLPAGFDPAGLLMYGATTGNVKDGKAKLVFVSTVQTGATNVEETLKGFFGALLNSTESHKPHFESLRRYFLETTIPTFLKKGAGGKKPREHYKSWHSLLMDLPTEKAGSSKSAEAKKLAPFTGMLVNDQTWPVIEMSISAMYPDWSCSREEFEIVKAGGDPWSVALNSDETEE